MKLSQIKQLTEAEVRPSQAPDFVQRSPEFQKLKELGGDKLANDVAVAWQGDARDYQRSGGKGFQPLVAQMLNDRVVERRYGIRLTPELRTVLSRIIQLSYHAFPDVDRLKATSNAPHSGGVWGNVWARECAEVEFDAALYEVIKADVLTLLSEEENRV